MADTRPIIDDEDGERRVNCWLSKKISSSSSANEQSAAVVDSRLPCPSCAGKGFISRDHQNELVALIPFSDKRLKPTNTWLWVIAAAVGCLLLSGLVLFFLLPRTIDLSSQSNSITNVAVISYKPKQSVEINFLSSVNVSNSNYYDIKLTNATSKVSKLFYRSRSEVVGYGHNGTVMRIPMLSHAFPVDLNFTITLSDWALDICELSFGYMRLNFQFTFTFDYLLNHKEQLTLEKTQFVCCNRLGHC